VISFVVSLMQKILHSMLMTLCTHLNAFIKERLISTQARSANTSQAVSTGESLVYWRIYIYTWWTCHLQRKTFKCFCLLYHFRHDNFVFIYSSLYQIWLTRNRISQKVYLNGRDEAPKPPVLMNLATILNQKPAFCFLVVAKKPLLLFDAKTYWGIKYTIQ